jgi:hypothetical protein
MSLSNSFVLVRSKAYQIDLEKSSATENNNATNILHFYKAQSFSCLSIDVVQVLSA